MYALSCTSMFALGIVGLLSLFGFSFSLRLLGPLTQPIVVIPVLLASIVLITVGSLQHGGLTLILATVGSGLSYAGMSQMLSNADMTAMQGQATYIAWLGIILIFGSYANSSLRKRRMKVTEPVEPVLTSVSRAKAKPEAAAILCILSGAMILAGAFFLQSMFVGMTGMSTSKVGEMTEMMNQMTPDMMSAMMMSMPLMMPMMFVGFGHTMTLFLTSVGFVSGSLVLVSGLMLYTKPDERSVWGIIALVFSVLSLTVFTGIFSLVGFVLGLIGGVLALTRRASS